LQLKCNRKLLGSDEQKREHTGHVLRERILTQFALSFARHWFDFLTRLRLRWEEVCGTRHVRESAERIAEESLIGIDCLFAALFRYELTRTGAPRRVSAAQRSVSAVRALCDGVVDLVDHRQEVVVTRLLICFLTKHLLVHTRRVFQECLFGRIVILAETLGSVRDLVDN